MDIYMYMCIINRSTPTNISFYMRSISITDYFSHTQGPSVTYFFCPSDPFLVRHTCSAAVSSDLFALLFSIHLAFIILYYVLLQQAIKKEWKMQSYRTGRSLKKASQKEIVILREALLIRYVRAGYLMVITNEWKKIMIIIEWHSKSKKHYS